MDVVVEALHGDHKVRSLSKTELQNTAKKNRIIYDKDFLVECFKHPASLKKPSGFPLPNLECTLATARSKTPYIMRKSYGHGPSTWTSDNDNSSWTNRRKTHNGNASRYEREREYNRHGNQDRDRNHRQDEDEPEWFSEGPTSRMDTIELRGFKDDVRNDVKNDVRNDVRSDVKNDVRNDGRNDVGTEEPKPTMKNNGFEIDAAALLSISFGDNQDELEKPTGTSRFSAIFERNSAAKAKKPVEQQPELEKKDPPIITNDELEQHLATFHYQSHGETKEVPPKVAKSQQVHELEEALRNILFRSTNLEQRKAKDNSDFVKMIESMSFRKQIAEEERAAEAAAAQKVQDDIAREARLVEEREAATKAAEEAAFYQAAWEESSRNQELAQNNMQNFPHHPPYMQHMMERPMSWMPRPMSWMPRPHAPHVYMSEPPMSWMPRPHAPHMFMSVRPHALHVGPAPAPHIPDARIGQVLQTRFTSNQNTDRFYENM